MSGGDAGDPLIELPLRTGDLPGVGGRIKASPADFQVEEIPAYPCSGEGEHVFLRIRREGWNTKDLARTLQKQFRLREADVGYAGLKDRQARVIQSFSLHLPGGAPAEVCAEQFRANHPELEVLSAVRHGNKLRLGHLRGNRFVLLLSDVRPEALERARAKCAALETRRIPNYFGAQRFGARGDNAARGRELLQGRGRAEKWLRKLLLSAFQSELFNRWIALRIERDCFADLLAGDVALRADSGAPFLVEAERLDAERTRLVRGEILPGGPLFGQRMPAGRGEATKLEEQILAAAGVSAEDFGRAKLPGGRRAAWLVPIAEEATGPRERIEAAETPEGRPALRVRIALPPGGYATSFLREVQTDRLESAD